MCDPGKPNDSRLTGQVEPGRHWLCLVLVRAEHDSWYAFRIALAFLLSLSLAPSGRFGVALSWCAGGICEPVCHARR